MRPTLVFLHYFSGSAESWRYVVDVLSPQYRCIAIDLPGFGGCRMINSPSIRSYSNWVWNRLQSESAGDVTLIG